MENKPELIEFKYYWVKKFSESEYEPATVRHFYRSNTLYFMFTNGSEMKCSNTKDYKELINPFNT